MSRRIVSHWVVTTAALALLVAGCDSSTPSEESSSGEPSDSRSAAAAMQSWTEFCDKADPGTIAEHLGAASVTIDGDSFTGEGSFGELASGTCGGVVEFEPGNGAPFQVALRAYGSASEAEDSLAEWRDSGTWQTPVNEVGSIDEPLWIVQGDLGSTYQLDGSMVHDFYRITFTVSYPVYDESDECGATGPVCTEDPADTLQWFEATYLPELVERIDAAQG
ncbi:hypothetical protein [Glycomyces paridis]|uniref:DUF3558 domain-containing protein n=1 Tax=Glycomyces paridis TaxID=2126555 RepID=A0A4S8PBA1_9ACTN|nr:hypothetical protein [Glycomyces paridis]THV26795.1 hypothetical protein E9998_17575 [Glycomyces paridis]